MSTSETYRPRFGFDIRIHPDRPRPGAHGAPFMGATPRLCAAPGCDALAELRAPKSRGNLDEREWLCRQHLRAHNERWDFFAGMTAKEIERFRIDAITGHRPTWPLGKRVANGHTSADATHGKGWSYRFEDAFGNFEAPDEAPRAPRPSRLTKGQLDALAALNLEEGATLHQIKARYKELVKRFHPDANGGDRGTEERLKQVIRAYGHLRASKLV